MRKVETRRNLATLARRYTLEMMEILMEILRDRTAPISARNAAARSLIARGWIKSPKGPDAPGLQ